MMGSISAANGVLGGGTDDPRSDVSADGWRADSKTGLWTFTARGSTKKKSVNLWRDFNDISATPTDVVFDQEQISEVSLSITGAPSFSIFNLDATPHVLGRDRSAIRRSVEDLVLVVTVVNGIIFVEQSGRSLVALQNDILVIFMDVPFRLSHRQDTSTRGSRLPASNFPRAVRDQTPLLLTSRSSSLASIVGNHLAWRPEDHEDFLCHGDFVKDQFVALLRRGLNIGAPYQTNTSSILIAAKSIIDAEIANPDLSAKLLCARLGVSRTRLFEVLTADGETLGNLIRERRLAGCRDEMMRSDRNETIATISERWGFRDTSTFIRAFRRRFGEPPARWSRAMREISGPADINE